MYKWVHFLKNKDRVFEKFNKFREFVEMQCGKPVKKIKLAPVEKTR